jgi:hypothetical protein
MMGIEELTDAGNKQMQSTKKKKKVEEDLE